MSAANLNNPLAKHFRQPAIYLKLPSGGKHYPDGSIELGLTGEVAVYPMTVKDEILIRTPDALLNGESIVNLILSCCPAIKRPYDIPATDIDAILIAIRLASYEQGVDIDSTCMHCKHENSHTIDLQAVLDSIGPGADYDKTYTVDGLTVKLQPQKFDNINLAGLIMFEQQKLVASIQSSEITQEEKKAFFDVSFKKLTDLNITTLARNIQSITTEDGIEVIDQNLIKEFLLGANRTIYEQLKKIITATIDSNKLKPLSMTCEECNEVYPVEVDFNQTNFFV